MWKVSHCPMLLCELDPPLSCHLIKRIVLQLQLCAVGHLRKLSCSIIVQNYCDGRPPPQLRETLLAQKKEISAYKIELKSIICAAIKNQHTADQRAILQEYVLHKKTN